MARWQALEPLRVIPVHPVAQRLAVHPGLIRRFGPGSAIKHQCEREKAPDLASITAFRCDSAKILRRVLSSGNGEWLAHSILFLAGERPRRYRIELPDRFPAPGRVNV